MRKLFVMAFILFSCHTHGTAGFDPLTEESAPDPNSPPAVVELTISQKGARMPGHIYLANGAGPHPTVVLLHGLPGNERNLDVAQALRRAGFNVLYFHYRGAWGADGKYRMSRLDDDALAVLAYLREPETAARLRVDPQKLSLLGHSLGGFAALATGRQDEGLACVVSLSPANLGAWKAALDNKDPDALGRLANYANTLFMLEDFNSGVLLKDLSATPMEELDTTSFAPGLRDKSVLMIVGDEDRVTPAETMFNPVVAAYEKDSAIRLQHHIISGDHSFSWSRLALSRLILDWMQANCR